MVVLILGEVINGVLNLDVIVKVVGVVKVLGDVMVLCVGVLVQVVGVEVVGIVGVVKVLVVEVLFYGYWLVELIVVLIVLLVGDYFYIVVFVMMDVKNIMFCVVVLLDVMVIFDVLVVVDGDMFECLIYVGNVIQIVKFKDVIKVFIVCIVSFDVVGMGGLVVVLDVFVVVDLGLFVWVFDEVVVSDWFELVLVKWVVLGGCGVGLKENFVVIEVLVDKLGVVVGVLCVVVDLGYVLNDWQVGQIGKVVVLELYVVVGIFGVIQYFVGMKDSKVIVVINKDEEVLIFQIVDYGLVGDLFSIILELIEKL